jgi:hypothetical protein
VHPREWKTAWKRVVVLANVRFFVPASSGFDFFPSDSASTRLLDWGFQKEMNTTQNVVCKHRVFSLALLVLDYLLYFVMHGLR